MIIKLISYQNSPTAVLYLVSWPFYVYEWWLPVRNGDATTAVSPEAAVIFAVAVWLLVLFSNFTAFVVTVVVAFPNIAGIFMLNGNNDIDDNKDYFEYSYHFIIATIALILILLLFLGNF